VTTVYATPSTGKQTGRTLQLASVWSGVAFLLIYGLFWGLVGHFLPPHPPSWSAAHVARFYAIHRTSIRIGLVGAMLACGLLMPFFAVIIGHLQRIEHGRMPLLTILGACGLAVLEMLFLLVEVIWLVATYRTNLPASTLRMLNDMGWITYVMVIPSYIWQLVVVGIAAFQDRSEDPVWPRWLGYLSFWAAGTAIGGLFAVFVTRGPVAWNGAVGFWIPIADFVVWVCAVTWVMHGWYGRARRAS
jgi:hypothetical protein